MEELLCMIKVIEDNVRILHRNVIGNNFMGIHNVIGDYYEELDEMADDLVEIAIAMGLREPNIVKAAELYPCIPTNRIMDGFTSVEAMSYVSKYFNDLIEAMKNAKKGLPDFVKAKLDEYQYWLYKEANYKIAQLLKGQE
jgi:DNA-binding ferritin-like protein